VEWLTHRLPGSSLLHNLQSTHFEHEVAQLLVREGYSNVFCRCEAPLLRRGNLGDADVIAFDSPSKNRRVRVCECKLNIGDDLDAQLASGEKVKKLDKRAKVIREDFQEQGDRWGHSLAFEAWLVTNATTADAFAWQAAKKTGVRLMTATLSPNWRDRGDWTVNKIEPMKPPAGDR